MLLRLFIAALWSPAGKGLTSKLFFVMFNCVFVTFPCGILGQVLYLIVSILDLTFIELYGFLFNCTMVGQASDSMMALAQSFKRWLVPDVYLMMGPPWICES